MREFVFSQVFWQLIMATRWTILLGLIAFIGGGIFGLFFTFMRISTFRPVMWFSKIYISIFQGTPLLMQLFVIFFGLPLLIGKDISPWASAGIAFTAFTSAYFAEIWRGCVQAIPKEQWEAGASIGLSYLQQVWYVIIPQAVKIAIPPTVGFSVQVIKNTSLTSIIGFIELTRTAQALNNVTFKPFVIFGMICFIYFSLNYPLSILSKRLEAKLHVAGRN